MNYMKEIAALLGVELNEEFEIIDDYDNILFHKYKLTEFGLKRNAGEWEMTQDILECLLIGMYTIKKLPFKPKYGEYYWTPMSSKIGVVSEDYKWENLPYDYLAYYNGLCFRTKEEAEANEGKVIKIIDYYKEN